MTSEQDAGRCTCDVPPEQVSRLLGPRHEQTCPMYRPQPAPAQGRHFPVMLGPRQRGRMYIPWQLAEEAYAVYSSRHGTEQSLERLAERGGFGESELDEFVPSWRERADTINALQQRLADAEQERDKLNEYQRRLDAALAERDWHREQWRDVERRWVQAERELAALRASLKHAVSCCKRSCRECGQIYAAITGAGLDALHQPAGDTGGSDSEDE